MTDTATWTARDEADLARVIYGIAVLPRDEAASLAADAAAAPDDATRFDTLTRQPSGAEVRCRWIIQAVRGRRISDGAPTLKWRLTLADRATLTGSRAPAAADRCLYVDAATRQRCTLPDFHSQENHAYAAQPED